MSYRDRRNARADRLDGWADKREVSATAGFEKADALADMIPFGQPILAGHHSEDRHRRDLDRINAAGFRALEDSQKADAMHSKAANIRAAADRAIYSDDEDAVERLKERIVGWEAERGRIKAYNASCRKGAPDASLLDDAQRGNLASIARHAAYQLGKQGQFPGYATSNITGRIASARKRLASLELKAEGRSE